jgi:hypothetical protein
LKTKKYESLIKWLSILEEALIKIHADELLEDCKMLINTNKHLNNIRHDKLEVSLNYFMSQVALLAVDIRALNLDQK